MNKNQHRSKMVEATLGKSETKICEACGAAFSCGARAEKCWCFDVALSAETLAKLQENFRSCLCRSCLSKIDQELRNNARTHDARTS